MATSFELVVLMAQSMIRSVQRWLVAGLMEMVAPDWMLAVREQTALASCLRAMARLLALRKAPIATSRQLGSEVDHRDTPTGLGGRTAVGDVVGADERR